MKWQFPRWTSVPQQSPEKQICQKKTWRDISYVAVTRMALNAGGNGGRHKDGRSCLRMSARISRRRLEDRLNLLPLVTAVFLFSTL